MNNFSELISLEDIVVNHTIWKIFGKRTLYFFIPNPFFWFFKLIIKEIKYEYYLAGIHPDIIIFINFYIETRLSTAR